jgi:hypothetical protein
VSLRADIDRGLEITAEMEKLSVELKDIEVRVKHAALHGEQVDLNDADREGRQFIAAGTAKAVPVILTSDMIIGEFGKGSERHLKIVDSITHDGKVLEFFKAVNKFENRFDSGKKFRKHADEVFGSEAPAFLTACIARDKAGIPKCAIKVMWGDANTKTH